MEHAGRHALVTGGGTGIGKGIALALANAGAEVTITGRTLATLEETAAQSPRLHPLIMDVADEASVRDGVAAAAQLRGNVSICVANAGIAETMKFATTTMDEWRRMMATNLDGVFVTFQAALATLDSGDWGRMIAVSSIAGVKGLRNAIPYTVTKHGVIGMIRGLSEEYMSRPITFNALCPGYVNTDIVQNQIPGLMRRFNLDEAGAIAAIARGNRSQTLLEVDETTAAAMYICSDAARNFNGQTLEISGGQV